jgi:hypothetical protein
MRKVLVAEEVLDLFFGYERSQMTKRFISLLTGIISTFLYSHKKTS